MSDLREALSAETTLNIESVIHDKHPELVQPYLDALAAARRFLALTETGQRVEWCEFHESPVSWWPFTDPQPNARCLWWSHSADPSDCHVVPKFLADYLTEETE